MFITNIKLKNFRNYDEQKITLDKNINVFYGDNAQGKTNIIESIYMCAIGKSFRTNKEKEIIKFKNNFASIFLEYEKSDRCGNIKVEIADKKSIYLNNIKTKKLSEILGSLNIVIFTPEDINILKNGPANRRRFLDVMIGQLRPNYIFVLNNYNKVLEQRNNYLKQIKYDKKPENLLDIWDEKLAEYGEKIYLYRKEFTEKIKNKIKEIHDIITEGIEEIDLIYKSDCINKSEFLKKIQNNRKLDIIKGFTNYGVHRDDFMIYINSILVNIYGSQGQHRTAMLSLKKAELEVVKDDIGEYPILLLDDFMSELDEKRRINFLKNISDTQVIITCTDEMKNTEFNFKLNRVESGQIRKSK